MSNIDDCIMHGVEEQAERFSKMLAAENEDRIISMAADTARLRQAVSRLVEVTAEVLKKLDELGITINPIEKS